MEINKPLFTTEKAKRDALLIKDALENGNQRAYSELLRFYRDPLYFTLLKMMKNPSDAEDLTIEAFGKAFKNLEKYSPDFAFSTWLFRIAVNNCIDYMRRKNNSPQCVDEDFVVFENNCDKRDIYAQFSQEEHYMEKERVRMMHLAVNQLRPKYKTLIELRYFQELSYEEISKELNISMNNVKIQLFRAKYMLSSIMEKVKYAI
ncbi:MAG TPA: sigma-70 family RNA polymerase sigma factor [Bacteroidales bacterium]|nr:sigma-70 family RNA polymerase sigma factor [Bacteroidales bacterium]HPT52791.1 sigma-70 family RNA polymerase sigma factor [Bacteroidales bacterium]